MGEDIEVVVRVRRLTRSQGRGDRVVFVPDPVAWTEVPSRLLFEGIGYRRLTAFWRFRGLTRIARGSREWGVMTREGFGGESASSKAMTENERQSA